MLTKLVLENFKCFNHADIVFKPLTILTGTNSSGKSSVIQAVLMSVAYGSSATPLLKYDLRPYGFQLFTELRTQNASENKIVLKLWDGDDRFNDIKLLRGESGEVQVQLDSSIDRQYEENLFYLSADRFGAQSTASVFDDLKVGSDGQAILGTFNKLKESPIHDNLIHPDAYSSKLLVQVAYWLTRITGNEIEAQTEQVGSTEVRPFFKVKNSYDGGLENTAVERSPFNVGAGNSYLLKLIVMCLIAKPDDVLLIENPEIHLHPKAQAGVGEFLAFVASRGVQIIAETHCEHLINQVRYEVKTNKISSDDIVIHYKPSVQEDFETIFIKQSGHYVDKDGQLIKFPTGFFNATLQQLIEIS
jgi:predicted ATPase